MFDSLVAIEKLLREFGSPWVFCGGWAIDLFLNRVTRSHKDVDIAIRRRDQLDVQAYLTERGWTLQIAHDGRLIPWQAGERVELPHHGIWATCPASTPDLLEILLNEADDSVFRFRRDLSITLDFRKAIMRAPNGLPILAPEVVLLYKAARPHEPESAADFRSALPMLEISQRRWLVAALSKTRPGHPWLAELAV